MRLKQRSSADFPQPGGPMNALHLLFGDLEINATQRLGGAVVEINPSDFNYCPCGADRRPGGEANINIASPK